MNILINYVIFNLALAISYLTTRSILEYCLNFQYLYKQRLILARFALVMIVVAFCGMPYFMHWFAIKSSVQLQFQPFVRHASEQLLGYYTTLPIATTQLKETVISMPTLDNLLIGIFIAVISLNFVYQLRNAYHLIHLVCHSYRIRQHGHIKILMSEIIQIPICFSFLNKSYVILPAKIIENNAYCKIAIAHELQHIRQKDTQWLYLLILLKIICVLNPFVWLWIHWLNELQEFACDEKVIQRKNTSPIVYGECLLESAKTVVASKSCYTALSLFDSKKIKATSHLYRRIEMLFRHKKQTHKSLFSILAAIMLMLSSFSTAYALNGGNNTILSLSQLQTITNSMNANKNAVSVAATPEALAQINAMRADPKVKEYMTAALQRLAQYKPMIQKQLKQRNMPNDLLALPLTESGYQNLDAGKNVVSAAGIWQVVPVTAHKYGMVINDTRDDRLDPAIETKAALNYLQKLHVQFNDWNLALVAYEIGEKATQQLINQVGSRNSWDLARSNYASADLKKYLPALNASMIIMHNPALLNG